MLAKARQEDAFSKGPDDSSYPTGRWFAGSSRRTALLIVTFTYLFAGLIAWVSVVVFSDLDPLISALLADLLATLVIFGASMLLANSSLYDPYWSVAPPVIAIAWISGAWDGMSGEERIRAIAVAALISVWAIRLTFNWARTWPGLGDEDWRYVSIRVDTRGRLPWWLVSLTGIQMLPTLVVFGGMVSVWAATGVADRPLGWLDLVALIVTAGAILVESLADRQRRLFALDPGNRGKACDRGLWRLCRHPNYLGEIGFWFGLWFFGLAAAPGWWPTILGPLAMVALFVLVSVPMMDRRSLERRPDYSQLMKRLPALLPRPKRR